MTGLRYPFNPYDFANPICDLDLFIGREDALKEIEYYMDYAKQAKYPINLAIIGKRASGKTSLLNMCEIKAKEREFLTVRVDLDESDSKNTFNFFYKLFDCVLSSACEHGAFGGINDKTYENYLDIINTYNIPVDKTFCPFLFPLQYAKAMTANRNDPNLSDHNFKKDLRTIYEEVNRPIIILIDECNVLINSSIHLQKLRNIFMNNQGYMLVFTGTQSLFPVMNEVFSPIIRQFKKINLAEFSEHAETKACMEKPLEKHDIKLRDVIDIETYYDIREIHSLSGGWPYEINLLCHFLFRRVQEGRAHRMKIDTSVLEEVRRELEGSQNIANRHVINSIKVLEDKQLRALNILCVCSGKVSFEQLWRWYYVFNQSKDYTKEELKAELDYFIENKIINIDEADTIDFLGDHFDSIYMKYYSREKNIQYNFLFSDISVERLWFSEIRNTFMNTLVKNFNIYGVFPTPVDINLLSIIEQINAGNSDVFSKYPSVMRPLYEFLIRNKEHLNISITELNIDSSWIKKKIWVCEGYNDSDANIGKKKEISNNLKLLIEEVNGWVDVVYHQVEMVSTKALVENVIKTDNVDFRKELFKRHLLKAIKKYLDCKTLSVEDLNEVVLHANLACDYSNDDWQWDYANNIGYLYISAGQYDKAKPILQKAVKNAKEPIEYALATYNMGVLYVAEGNILKGKDYITSCITTIDDHVQDENEFSCLFKVVHQANSVSLVEDRDNPILKEIAESSLEALELLFD